MSERKLYKYICENCGSPIYSVGKRKKWVCEDCQKIKKRESNRKYNKKIKTPKKIKAKTLSQCLQELAEYNEKHGTFLSYGKFMLLTKEHKECKIKEHK